MQTGPHPTRHALILAIATTLLASSAFAQQGMSTTKQGQGRMNAAQVDRMVAAWPKASREAVAFLTKKYGQPAAVTADAAIRGTAGLWKRTLVLREEVTHNVPMPHTDVMQQWVDYRAPAGKYDELAAYDGSVVMERIAGEMSARCDKEGANFLAVNLADEVARGKRSVDDARMKYGEQIMAMKAGKPAPCTTGLRFPVAAMTEDADKALPGT